MTPRSRRAAFTLIELLVVIAIISILAAILFPVFANAREKARQITCISNLKEVGTAVRMYVQDYDETFPIFQAYNVLDDHNTGQSGAPWQPGHLGVELETLPYIQSHNIYQCPDDPDKPDPATAAQYGNGSYFNLFGSSYRFDRGCFTVIAGPLGSYSNDAQVTDSLGNIVTANTIVTDSSFVQESTTRIMRDEEFPWFGPQNDPTGAKYDYYYPGSSSYYNQWHPQGGGMVFADGHAKFITTETYFDSIAGNAQGQSYNQGCWSACE